jgi:hypothetical protein
MENYNERIRSALIRLVEGHHIPGGHGGQVNLPPASEGAAAPWDYVAACLGMDGDGADYFAFLGHSRYSTFRLRALRDALEGNGTRPQGGAEGSSVADLVEAEVKSIIALLPPTIGLSGDGDGEEIGWEYGTPPGLAPAEWPRHAKSGMPLAHGFTIHLPEAYRARGPEYVALSFFHPAESESCPNEDEEVEERVEAVLGGDPLDEDEEANPYFCALVAHLAAAKAPSRERLVQTFADSLGHTHALVWHTEASLSAPRCERPSEEPPEGYDPEAFIEANEPASPLFVTTGRRRIQLGRPLHPMQGHGVVNGMSLHVLEVRSGGGGVNFGDGTGQLDLETGTFDWAC